MTVRGGDRVCGAQNRGYNGPTMGGSSTHWPIKMASVNRGGKHQKEKGPGGVVGGEDENIAGNWPLKSGWATYLFGSVCQKKIGNC